MILRCTRIALRPSLGSTSQTTELEHPVELYEWMLKVYKDTPREKLIEWTSPHIKADVLDKLSQDELVKRYTEGLAQGSARNMKEWKKEAD